MSLLKLASILGFARLVASHASIFHPSMYGFNVTAQTFPYDNRPVAPLQDMTFDQWWFHGHLDFPPNPGDIFDLPAGQTATTEIACDKGATTWFNSSEGGDIRQGDNVCPGQPTKEFHANNIEDTRGCALAIAYKNDARDVQPEDFTVFSVNQTCVWTRFTDFQVPEKMPPCPEGGCTCAFFWIHAPDSGSEQNYMNGFKCNITGSTSNVALAKSKVPRRCGADPLGHKLFSAPANCTYGAKQPFYWDQTEQNNMFEDVQAPPFYNDLYNFLDGAQNDIFEDSYDSIPEPSPVAAMPILANLSIPGLPIIILKQGNATVGLLDPSDGEAANATVNASPSGASVNSTYARRSTTGGLLDPDSETRDGWKRSRIAASWHRRQMQRRVLRDRGSRDLDLDERRRGMVRGLSWFAGKYRR